MEHWRVNLIFIFIFFFGAVIAGKLFVLQIQNYDYYKALAQGQQRSYDNIQGERGEIFIQDKKGNLYPLAKNQDTENGLQRYYPQEFFASQVVGFLGGEGIGQYGLEGYYEDALEGEEKLQQGERNPWISFFSTKKNPAQRGSDLILTIDYNIQFRAEKLLEEARQNLNIEGGEIIIMDPNSGKILAMANFPNFNPNEYSQEKNFEVFKNGAIQEIFEPGSVLKAITMAAALDDGKITPQTTYVDTGSVEIGKYTLSNYNKKVYGKRTMTEVLEKSINTGAIFAENSLGHSSFLKYLEKFGFFERTGIDLKAEVFSQNKELKKGYEVNFATASYGQGIEITPIQLAVAYSAIANGGKLVKPYVVETKRNGDGEMIKISPEITKNRVLASKTSSQLTAMLVSVLENGFAKEARVPGYYIAGKTGTSQISWSALDINKQGYSEKTWQSFVGFGPAFEPKFLILVKLDNPMTKIAGYSAVPIFQDLAKYIIDYWEIPPDYK